VPLRSLLSSNADAQLRAVDKSLAVITFAVDGTILDANQNFRDVVGYSREELAGKHHRLFMDPQDAASPEYEAFWTKLRRGEFQSAEYRRLGKSGRPIWLRATYNPVLDGRGRPVRVVKIASDITAEKLRALDDAGQIAAIHRSQAVIAFDLDGTILEANDNFLRVVKYRCDEIVGKHHSIFVPPEERGQPAYQAFWAALRRGEFQAAEYRRIGKGGHEVWIRATYNPILGADGKPARVVKFAVDVTDEKKQNADYEGQIAAIRRTQAVIAFDINGIVLEANDVFLSTMGYRIEEVRGHHHRMFVEPGYAQGKDYAAFWERLGRGEAMSAIYQRLTKSGQMVWLQAIYSPILGLDGQPVKVVKYATDITANMASRSLAVAAAQETLSNVEAVAAAAEEMNVAIADIAEGMNQSKTAVDEIHAETAAADRATAQLQQAAQSMDGVVQLIAKVAEQINLLALNATIESARAGEAGRGFAVVATEVKNLANQARSATTRIADEIVAMQGVSTEVVGKLASITAAIGSVQSFVGSATRSIEEQSAVTRDISLNMQTAAAGVASVGRNLDNWIVGMEERRFDERVRVIKPGRILAGAGRTLECSVRDISAGGAKLVLANTADVPDKFQLQVEDTTRQCQVTRRAAGELGVKFAQ